MLLSLFIAALWSPEGKGLTSWLLFMMFIVIFVTFPFGILGQVWYLIVSIPDLCCLSYFVLMLKLRINSYGHVGTVSSHYHTIFLCKFD